MNTPLEQSTPTPQASQFWWWRLAWWKKIILILLTLILTGYGLDYCINTLFMPPQASPQAIELKYKAQLDRLKEYADRRNWHPTIESEASDAALFSLPEIVSAKLETSPNSFLIISEKPPAMGSRWGFAFRSQGAWTKKFYQTLNDGSKRTIVVYHSTYNSPAKGETGLILEFDLAKLQP